LALAAVGLLVARGVDPGAAKDRDAAEAALLTNSDLGGTFSETAHRTSARSRGGLRVEGDLAECGAPNGAFEKSGQAVVEAVLNYALDAPGSISGQIGEMAGSTLTGLVHRFGS